MFLLMMIDSKVSYLRNRSRVNLVEDFAKDDTTS